jgi:acetoin utilization protein AcuB
MEAARTREVPPEDWAAYLRHVESLQRDTTIQIELVGPELGDQPLARQARLRAISATGRGPVPSAIELELGANGGLDHRVLHPVHLYAIQAPTGQLEVLDIEDQSQTKTLIRFLEPRPVAHEGSGDPFLVRNTMTAPAQVLRSGSSLVQALDLMKRYDIRHLPIVDSDGKLVGVLSDRELYLAKHERGIAPEDVTVDEVMADVPYTVAPSTPLEEAAAKMAHWKYGCAVVVEDDRVVGMVTTTDALRALVRLRAEAATAPP